MPEPKKDFETLYPVVMSALSSASDLTWSRLYNFLTACSILVLSWVTLYSAQEKTTGHCVAMIVVCIVGLMAGLAWSALGYRGHRNTGILLDLGVTLEKNQYGDDADSSAELAELAPMHALKRTRDTIRFPFAGSYFMLPGVPLLFAGLFAVLLVIGVKW